VIAQHHDVTRDAVVVGNGSTELIWAIARAYIAPGARSVVLGPTYGEYEVAVRATGGEALCVPAWSAGLHASADEMAAAIAEARPRLVWLCRPNNPTGVGVSLRVVMRLLEAADDALLVVDEAYLTLCPDLPSVLTLPHTVRLAVLRSMTKDAGLAGFRLGYLVADPEVAGTVERVVPPWSTSSVAQVAGMIALTDRGHLAAAQAAVAASRAHLVGGLVKLGLSPFPSEVNFVLVPVGDGASVARALLECGCAVRDCTSFGLPNCIRIGVRSVPDQELLLAALAKMLHG
jgi:histidinol-phosphate aminotransferase